MFSFKTQLSIGEIGEIIWYEANRQDVIRLDGFKSDFRVNACGSGLELKSDSYCMSKTPNFFFERYSSKEKQSPGGPWQALEHGSKYFVYFYVKNLAYFQFETEPLVAALNDIIPTLKPTDVKNSTYTTQGYRVARELLSRLYTPYRLSVQAERLS